MGNEQETRQKLDPWRVSEKSKRLWEESRQRIKEGKQLYIKHASQLGEALDATLIAITGLPPGSVADPAVYRSNQDATYFMVAGKKGEVASIRDPQEIQQRAKGRVGLPLDFIGEYAIVRFDFKHRIEEGGLFYTPAGYIEGKRYNPQSDPPMIPNQGETPSKAK